MAGLATAMTIRMASAIGSEHQEDPRRPQSLERYRGFFNLRFGIWMEPEMVNPASKCYKAHPDWIIQDGIAHPA
jgi:hypothetical protein